MTAQLDFFASAAASADETAAPAATDYRLFGKRVLAATWPRRAADNIAAIQLAARIEAEGRSATDEEKDRLIRFIGFGASDLANGLFNVSGKDRGAEWAKLSTSLRNNVTAAELAALASATRFAHYTPEYIVKAIWKGVKQLGFTGGAVLEPGCGTGLFLALMPEGIKSRSSFLGVENCPVTARIARLLYPESDILNQEFQRAVLPPGFDLAIGNPPFESVKVRATDPAGKLGVSLHNYFLARSIERLRPGGLAAFVVSRYMMDGSDLVARSFMAEHANLLGAIRLPQAAMRAEAGTDVVVDVVFFQRREDGTSGNGDLWTTTADVGLQIEGKPVHINRYFVDNPAMVLGNHTITSSQHGPTYTCAANGTPLDILLSGAIATLPTKVFVPATGPGASVRSMVATGPKVTVGTAATGARIKEGSFVADCGDLFQIVDGRPVAIEVKSGRGTSGIFPKHARIIRGLIEVRDAIRDVLRAQEADEPWHDAQARLNAAYDAFVAEFGPINTATVSERINPTTGEAKEYYRYPNLAPFKDDPDWPLVAECEHYDPENGHASKGAIFTQRVISPPPEVTVTSPADALVVSLNELGRVDLPRIAELLGQTEREVEEALREQIYFDPANACWETADAYLSGKVRDKLAAAREAAKTDARFERNIKALEAVQPVDLLPSEITARLGASWIPAEVVEAFCREKIGIPTRVFHTPEIGLWSVEQSAFRNKAAATAEWGTPRRHAGELLLDALSAVIPQIFDTFMENGSEHRILNVKETQAAQDKLAAMKEAFSAWVWSAPERADKLSALYNERFNNLVARTFNGDHLVLPGASDAITLRPHQRRGAWRMICSGSTYLAHVVGAGKTFTLIAGIMERRRLGLASKPMIVVPGHTLFQWAREFLQLYPNANILVADEENFEKSKRGRFVARAAMGNWDAVIITHSAFKFLTVPKDFEVGMINEQMDVYEEMLKHVDKDDRTSIKKIEHLKELLKVRYEALQGQKDDILTISEMGIDEIIVDEAQQFRKLPFATNMGSLKGVDPNGSQRAWDLYVKSKFLAESKPGSALFMASGTPITNTMGELFSLQRFMDEDVLRERGIQYFDAWASCFGETKTELELQPSGYYKPVTRFSQFVNIPELTAMFLETADVVLADDLARYVQLPAVAGGQRSIRTYDAGPGFRAYQKMLGGCLDLIKARGGKPQKGDDIILAVIGDGRHAAVDLRMGNVSHRAELLRNSHLWDRYEETVQQALKAANANNPENKLNGLIDNVVRIWKETADFKYTDPRTGDFYQRAGAAQMIFSDVGIDGSGARGFSAYDWIVRRLVAAGIPRDQIAVIHDYAKMEAKLRLFSAINQGLIRIVLGSTEKMGTGVNAQQRLYALHHLDEPWLPSSVEQREGRIRRQGNQNAEIFIYCYATLGSVDATMWQLLERKMRFIDAVMRGDKTVRRLDDLDADSQADQFAMAKAMSSGDDRLMKKAGLESEIAKLERQRQAHHDSQSMVRREVRYAAEAVERAQGELTHIDNDLRIIQLSEEFRITIEGVEFRDRKEAGEAIMRAIATAELEKREAKWVLAEYGGFKVWADGWTRSFAKSKSYHLQVWVARSGHKTEVFNQDLSNGVALIRRIEAALVPGIQDHRKDIVDRIAGYEARITDYSKRVSDAAFELQVVLDDKLKQLAEIDASLAASEAEEKAKEAEQAAAAQQKRAA